MKTKRESNLLSKPWAEVMVSYFKRNLGILVAFLLMVIFLSIATNTFLTVTNSVNVFRQIFTNVTISVGVMLAIMIGGIDLSVGSVIALAGCIAAKLLADFNVPIPISILVGCLAGTLVGLTNGLIISYTGMPPFVVTLAMQNICRGLAYLSTNGKTVRVNVPEFEIIGTGYAGPIPYLAIYTVIILIITFFILNRTVLGRHIYAVGGNREAARFSGIKPMTIEIFIYTFSGLLAAIAGVVLTARMASGQPTVGIGYETDAVAASVLGGTSMKGGVGTVGGMLIGALVIGVLSNGMNLLGINAFWQYVVKGVVIILAVYIDMLRKRIKDS